MRSVTQPAEVHLNGVHAAGPAHVFVPASLTAHERSSKRFTRVYELRDGRWRSFDVKETVYAVASARAPGDPSTFLVCRNGDVYKFDGVATTLEASLRPALPSLRWIGGDCYACGTGGRVFRRNNGQWVDWSRGIDRVEDEPTEPHLVDIDGTSADDLWAVTIDGGLFHYDGKRWTALESPTNYPINRIRCTSSGLVYIAGQHGVLFAGNASGWRCLGAPDPDLPEIWGLEIFAGRVYLSTMASLYTYDDGELHPLRPDLGDDWDTHFLDQVDGVLWSVGATSLATFDGDRWTRIPHPLSTVG